MVETKNISLTAAHRAFFTRLNCLFVAAIFLFAQTFSAAHSHDHSNNEQLSQSYEVCVLAVNVDEVDIVADGSSLRLMD